MAIFTYTSARGDVLPLNCENYALINIDSQTAATADLSTIVIGGTDGDIVNNAQAQARTIVLDLRIMADVELTKRHILQIIKLKQRCVLTWDQNGRKLQIKGIVEAIDMPRWTDATVMQITIHCDMPFWEAVDAVVNELREYISLHYFTDYPNDMLYFPEEGVVMGAYDATRTRGFHNAGDVSVGMEIEILALETATNPIIYDQDGKFFGCGYGTGTKKVTMQAGDMIKINTKKNEKSVTLNGVSIFDKIKPSSTWLQLDAGDNEFSINSDDESISNMAFSLIYKQRFI